MREMHFTYDELMALPQEYYDVLIEELIKEQKAREERR